MPLLYYGWEQTLLFLTRTSWTSRLSKGANPFCGTLNYHSFPRESKERKMFVMAKNIAFITSIPIFKQYILYSVFPKWIFNNSWPNINWWVKNFSNLLKLLILCNFHCHSRLCGNDMRTLDCRDINIFNFLFRIKNILRIFRSRSVSPVQNFIVSTFQNGPWFAILPAVVFSSVHIIKKVFLPLDGFIYYYGKWTVHLM